MFTRSRLQWIANNMRTDGHGRQSAGRCDAVTQDSLRRLIMHAGGSAGLSGALSAATKFSRSNFALAWPMTQIGSRDV